MANENKQETRFSLSLSTRASDDESRLFWSRSASLPDQLVESQRACSVPSKRPPTLLPYTPPDTLVFPLLSAIQRKAWVRAKRLCREVVSCDPERKIYQELYLRLDQLTNLADRRVQPRVIASSTTIATATATETAVGSETDEQAPPDLL